MAAQSQIGRVIGLVSWTGPGNPFHVSGCTHDQDKDRATRILFYTSKDSQDRLYYRTPSNMGWRRLMSQASYDDLNSVLKS